MSVIIILVIFSVIVVIHEYGHFAVAKKFNVRVEEFAVGMGPKIVSHKKGETEYSIRLLPLGGFCRMADEVTEGDKIGFNDASVYQRIAIGFAGPFMNFVLALVIMAGINACSGIATTNITEVIADTPAYEAGIEATDKIIKVDGHKIHTRNDLNYIISEDKSYEFLLKRDNQVITKSITPVYDTENARYYIGVKMEYKAPLINVMNYEGIENYKTSNLWDCVYQGYWDMLFLVKATFDGVVQLFTNQVSVNELSGPIGVTSVASDIYSQSISVGKIQVIISMLYLSAILSANLGVINLLPIPALDGGRILVYIIEIIRRKKIPPEKEGMIHLFGFMLLTGFGIYIAIHDVIKLL